MGSFVDRYKDFSDERLLEIAVSRRSEYQDEAVLTAEQLLEERGISVVEARRRIDEREANRRELIDEARSLHEESRQREIGRIAEEGRASGRCLLTGEPATTEIVIQLRRDLATREVANLSITSIEVLPVPIPLSEAAARRSRPLRLLKRLSPGWALVVFLGALLWPTIAAATGIGEGLPVALRVALLAGPFTLVLLISGLEAAHEHLLLKRLYRAHPLHAELKGRRYRAVPMERAGQPKLELYSQQLTSRTSSLRSWAEMGLVLMGGSAVVERMIELLDDKHACQSAIRVLGRLRATEAIPAIAPLTEHKSRLVREAARDALNDLTGQASRLAE